MVYSVKQLIVPQVSVLNFGACLLVQLEGGTCEFMGDDLLYDCETCLALFGKFELRRMQCSTSTVRFRRIWHQVLR